MTNQIQHRCLYCYQPLGDQAGDFHEKCSRYFFGTPIPPMLDYDISQMQDLAKQIVVRSIAVTGVQAKLSLDIVNVPTDPKTSRLTIVGLWGGYILKPPTEAFQNLPENEDLTMHLSELMGIPTAQHSLIRLQSGELAYLTKRFDRHKKEKLALEDMCQLTETLTEDKYRSSMERVGKQILEKSSRPGLDLVTFFELTLLSFLVGNADMHLKNFSLLTTREREIILSPAYDLVSTKVAMPADLEETALTINAKKRKLNKADFEALANRLSMPERTIENSFQKLQKTIPAMVQMIAISLMPDTHKNLYSEIIHNNALRLKI